MSYELFIALRYLKSKRKTGFISLISYISIAGVTIGVAALIIVLSVMNGFESEVRSRFIGVDAHVKVRTFHDKGVDDYTNIMQQIKDTPHIVAMTPYVHKKGLIKSKTETTGLIIRGIDIETINNVTDVQKSINYGELNIAIVEVEQEDGSTRQLPGIVLGFNLADRLMVTVGDQVILASFEDVTRVGQMPQMMQFVVTGYFETGLFEFDDNMAYISIVSAQKLFRMNNKVSGIGIKLDHYENANTVEQILDEELGYPYRVLTWYDLNQNLFAWMKIEKWAAFIILSLIIMVAAFNIISTMIMVTMEKTREIGILKSMGATSRGIQRIFTFEGLFVGVLGTVMGCLFGFALCWAQLRYKFFALPNDVYIIDWLPILMKWTDFTIIAVAAILITYSAAVYPASRAAKLDPVASIRYE
ncbi:FtsX-like permease family protein [candidate division KSB1 bacterium]|nr:ABC transporter permease [candidate division KSB1 bacterium]RQW00648.1 MAG: FtsX-like permease family protein [candidate division KSB1 bacterium]